jgi:hypothetical protein
MALAGVTGLAVFLTWKRRAAPPMLPLAVFAQRQFAAVNGVSFLVYGALARRSCCRWRCRSCRATRRSAPGWHCCR